MKLNILITGASSPSGQYAYNFYKNKGVVYTISRTPRNSSKHFCLDFSLDEIKFERSLSHVNFPAFDIIVNTLGATPHTIVSNEDYFRINFINQSIFFENLKLNDNSKLINFSSSSVYSKHDKEVSETSEIDFKNHYGVSKYLQERSLSSMASGYNSNQGSCFVLNARIPVLLTPFGCKNFIGNWINQIKKRELIYLSNPDSPFNNCVGIEDVFGLFEFLSKDNISGSKTLNVGVSNLITVKSLFNQVCEAIGQSAEFEAVKSQYPSQNFICDNATKLGYKFSSIEDVINENLKEAK